MKFVNFLKKYANFYYILLILNVCKQTFHISHVRISQKVKGVLMWNLQHIIFIWRRRYCQIFKSALVYLQTNWGNNINKFYSMGSVFVVFCLNVHTWFQTFIERFPVADLDFLQYLTWISLWQWLTARRRYILPQRVHQQCLTKKDVLSSALQVVFTDLIC